MKLLQTPQIPMATLDEAKSRRRRRMRLLLLLALAIVVLVGFGLAIGSAGLSWQALRVDLAGDQAMLIVGRIRAPRTIGALLVGALLGLSGALAQGLFRNPLADPYLLGSAAGASLGVVLVLAAGALGGHAITVATALWLDRLGLVAAAFCGALIGVAMTLAFARGAEQTVRLLLAGVVVGVLLGAVNDLATLVSPDALRGRQAFLLGTTGLLGWPGVLCLAAGLAVALPVSMRLGRVLDALTIGDDSATSLGLPLPRLRLLLVVVFALATGLAVSQSGLIAFVGLVSPHLVRRVAPGRHGYLLLASALTGGALLLSADVLARVMIAPQELPVGVVTALVGGAYLLWLLQRRSRT